MKLLGSVIVASTIAKNHEKSCVGQNCGCNAEEMMRWKNEMKNWKNDQERWRYEFNLWRKETDDEHHVDEQEISWPWYGKCAKTDSSYSLLDHQYFDGKMTRQKCRQICTSGYFVYFGLENGTDCYCGNIIHEPTYVSILECNKPCSGNPLEFCGGASKMNIQKTQTKCEKESAPAIRPVGGYVPQCWTIEEWDQVNDGPIMLGGNDVNVGAFKWKQVWSGLLHESWCVDLDGNRLNTTDSEQVNSCAPFYTGQCLNDLDGFTEGVQNRMLHDAHFSDDYLSQEKCLNACKSAFYRYAGVENGRDCYCGNAMKLFSLMEPHGGPGIVVQYPDQARIIPDIECNIPCSGNLNEKCGGENKLNIFNLKSKCEKERDDALEYLRPIPVLERPIGYWYPTCTASGEFEPKQSSGSTGYIWCVDMDGEEVPGTSTPPAQQPKPICNPYYTGQCVSNQNLTLVLTVSGDSMTRESCKTTCDSEDSTYYGLGNGRDCYCGNTVENPKLLPFPMCNSPCTGDENEMCGGVEALNLFSLKENANVPLV